MELEHISVSRNGLWNECQLKYLFQYVLKIPNPEPEKPWFKYGRVLHKIAELFTEGRDFSKWDQIVADVLSGKVEIQDGQTALGIDPSYKNKIGDHLRNLKRFIMSFGLDDPGHTEYKFTYDLMPPNNYLVTGFIDRIVIKKDFYFIIDYKTTKPGKWRNDKYSVMKDLQLRTYANVVHREFGVPPDKIACCLFYMDGGDGEIVSARYNKADMVSAEKELLATYLHIKNTEPTDVQANTGDHCFFCQYRRGCPQKSLTVVPKNVYTLPH